MPPEKPVVVHLLLGRKLRSALTIVVGLTKPPGDFSGNRVMRMAAMTENRSILIEMSVTGGR